MSQASLPLDPPIWRQPLAKLLPTLTAELDRIPANHWAYRHLPHGALVCVKRQEDGRRILRIARRERPETEAGLKKWAQEVDTFLAHFGTERWQSIPMDNLQGIAAGFLELWPEESSPGKTKCMDCATEIPFDIVFGSKDRCTPCARAAGSRGP